MVNLWKLIGADNAKTMSELGQCYYLVSVWLWEQVGGEIISELFETPNSLAA